MQKAHAQDDNADFGVQRLRTLGTETVRMSVK